MRTNKFLSFLALAAVAVLGGFVVSAAPPAQLPIQVPSSPLAADGLEADRWICPNGEEGVGSLMDVETQVGQPCCVELCEQICGIGEACACKRCQVFGCGLP